MIEITWPFDVSIFEKLRFRAFKVHHLATVETVFGGRKRRFSVDGCPNRRKKDALSNLSGLVWTGPNSKVVNLEGIFLE